MKEARPRLLREFIRAALYHPRHGYFTRQAGSVGSLDQPLDYKFILGESGYRAKLAEAYRTLGTAWLTPSEVFRPYFGQGVARYVLAEHAKLRTVDPLRIVEVGAGAGGLARDILDFVRDSAPHVYRDVQYTSVEASAELAARQTRRVSEDGGHGSRFQVQVRDAAEAGSWGDVDPRHTVVLAMEVLDNMPHDKVVRADPASAWMEACVRPRGAAAGPLDGGDAGERSGEAVASGSGRGGTGAGMFALRWGPEPPWLLNLSNDEVEEVLRPLSDPLVAAALSCREWMGPPRRASLRQWAQAAVDWVFGGEAQDTRLHDKDGSQVVWLPTVALSFLTEVMRARPNHSVVLADFDALPEVQIAGRNAPIVSFTKGGRAHDYDSVLVRCGEADIFFPTDFEALQSLYRSAGESAGSVGDGWVRHVECQHMPSSHFLRAWADTSKTLTPSGYNPMTEDFSNTRFFLGTSRIGSVHRISSYQMCHGVP